MQEKEDFNNVTSACDTYKLAEDVERGIRHNNAIKHLTSKPLNKSKTKLQEYLSQDNVKEYNSLVIDKSFKNCGLKTKKFMLGYNECKEEIEEYFQLCTRLNIIPTITALCLWLGCSKDTIYTYAKNKQMYEFSDLIKNAIDVCKLCNENGAIEGGISPQVFSLLASNYYGLNTSQQVEIKPVIDNQVNNSNTMKVIQEQIALENKSKNEL